MDTASSNMCKLLSVVPIRGTNRELVLIAKKKICKLKTSNSSPWSTCDHFPGTALALNNFVGGKYKKKKKKKVVSDCAIHFLISIKHASAFQTENSSPRNQVDV